MAGSASRADPAGRPGRLSTALAATAGSLVPELTAKTASKAASKAAAKAASKTSFGRGRCPPCLRSPRGCPRISSCTQTAVPARRRQRGRQAATTRQAPISARTSGSWMSCTSATRPILARSTRRGGTSSPTTSRSRRTRAPPPRRQPRQRQRSPPRRRKQVLHQHRQRLKPQCQRPQRRRQRQLRRPGQRHLPRQPAPARPASGAPPPGRRRT